MLQEGHGAATRSPSRIAVCGDVRALTGVRREYDAAGWTTYELDRCPPPAAGHPACTGERRLCVTRLGSTSDIARVVELLLAGVSVATVVDDPSLAADAFDQCRRIAVAEWFDQQRRPVTDGLSDEHLALLLAVRAGDDVGQAARRQLLSPRTAARRLTDARRLLGARSTAEAVSIVGHRVDELR